MSDDDQPVGGRSGPSYVPPVTISIVLPARNEARTIADDLAALAPQARAADCEIVVVDAGSQDGTPAIARAAAERLGVQATVVEAGAALPGRARNVGVATARGTIIAFIDANMRPGDGWIARIAAHFAAPDAPDVVYGTALPGGKTLGDRALYGLAGIGVRRGLSPSVPAMALRREVYQRAGGMPEDMRGAEDLVFFKRLTALGARCQRDPALVTLIASGNAPGPWRLLRKWTVYTRLAILAGERLVPKLATVAAWWLPVAVWLATRHPLATAAATAPLVARIWLLPALGGHFAGGRVAALACALPTYALAMDAGKLAGFTLAVVDLARGRRRR